MLRTHGVAVAVVLALSALSAGCSSRQTPSRTTEPPIGVYEFSTQASDVRGTVTIQSDTMLVDLEAGFCEPTRQPSFHFVGYRCAAQKYDSMHIRLDRRNPLRSSSWSAPVKSQRQRQVCAQQGRNQQGQPVCLYYRTESYETLSYVGGHLVLVPPR